MMKMISMTTSNMASLRLLLLARREQGQGRLMLLAGCRVVA